MLTDKLKTAVKKYGMFDGGDVLCVGLSGGADSVALLLALMQLSDEFGVSVRALHVNHRLRGEESDGDERFCRDLCEKMNIPFSFLDADVARHAKEAKLSIEEAARNTRYAWFNSMLDQIGQSAKICTAHTLNDSAETVIFNLCRGTGLKGLCGVPPRRGNIIRPLILCSRGEVETYLSEKGQTYRVDSTNLSTDCSRNKIRHLVVPVLEGINGGFLDNIAKFSEIILSENEYLDAEAKRRAQTDLRELDGVLRRRVIINILRDGDVDISSEAVETAERLIMSGGAKDVRINKHRRIKAENGKLFIIDNKDGERTTFGPIPIKNGDYTFLRDKSVSVNVNYNEFIAESANIHGNLTINRIDYDKIQGDVFLRNRRDGDRYIRAGRDFHSSLKKLFRGAVPREKRDSVAVLCDDRGIIWVEGFGAAERVKITSDTENVLNIAVRNE